jgi:hypothetical protein
MSKIEAGTVAVVVQDGTTYNLAADDFAEDERGYLNVTSDGRRVARFTPGYAGVYHHEDLVNILPPIPEAR